MAANQQDQLSAARLEVVPGALSITAIQSTCREVPQSHLEHGCYPAPGDWMSSANPALGSFPNVSTCGWYLKATPSSSLQLLTGYVIGNTTGSAGEALVARFFPLRDLFSRRAYYGGTIGFKDVRNPMFDFLVATVRSSADLVPLPGSSLIPNRSQGNGQNCAGPYR